MTDTDQVEETIEHLDLPVTGSEETEQTIEIGGEMLTLAEAQELLSKGRDYTRKTQEIAELRRENEQKLQAYEYISQMAEESPDQLIEYIQRNYGGSASAGTASNVGTMPEFATDVEEMLWKENQAIKAQMKTALDKIEHLGGQFMVNSSVADVQKETGLTLTASEIQASMKRTGINDPVAAVAKDKLQDIRAHWQKEAQEAARRKPFTPTGDANTYDPNDPKLSAEAIFDLQMQGAVPKS